MTINEIDNKLQSKLDELDERFELELNKLIEEKRATYILYASDVEKLKAIAYWERKKINTIAKDMIKYYIASYEKWNGTVQPKP